MSDFKELIQACQSGEAAKVYELASDKITEKVNDKLKSVKTDMLNTVLEAKKKNKDVGSVTDTEDLIDGKQKLEKALETSNQDLSQEDKKILKAAIKDLNLAKKKSKLQENVNFSAWPNRHGGSSHIPGIENKDGPLFFSKEMITALEKSITKRNLTPFLSKIKDIFSEMHWKDKIKVIYKDEAQSEFRDMTNSIALMKKIPPFDKADNTFVELATALLKDNMMAQTSSPEESLGSTKLKGSN